MFSVYVMDKALTGRLSCRCTVLVKGRICYAFKSLPRFTQASLSRATNHGLLVKILVIYEVVLTYFNPIALRMAKTLWSLGHSKCSRVN